MRIGLSNFMSRLLAALNGTEYFIASWIAIFTIEKFGRRKLMLFGAVGMSGSMVVLAATSKFSDVSKGSGIVAAVFLFVFNSFFAVGWLGMTWLYPAEVTPLSIRAPANAISTTANWIFNVCQRCFCDLAFMKKRRATDLLALVHGRDGHTCGIFEYRVPNIHHIRRYQRIHGPLRILLLPRNCLSIFGRGKRFHLPLLLCRY